MIAPARFALLVVVAWAWLTHLPHYPNILRRLTGAILVGLGVRLVLTEQR